MSFSIPGEGFGSLCLHCMIAAIRLRARHLSKYNFSKLFNWDVQLNQNV